MKPIAAETWAANALDRPLTRSHGAAGGGTEARARRLSPACISGIAGGRALHWGSGINSGAGINWGSGILPDMTRLWSFAVDGPTEGSVGRDARPPQDPDMPHAPTARPLTPLSRRLLAPCCSAIMANPMSHNTWIVPALAAAALLFPARAAVAAAISIGALKDTTIFSESDNTLGGGDVFIVGNNNATGPTGNTRRGLIQFDIAAAIPSGATIQSVTLKLHVDGGTSLADDRIVSIHRLLAEWGNGTSGAGGAGGGGGQGVAPADSDVTWAFRSYSVSPPTPPQVAWTSPGGDFLAGASASTSVNSTPAFYSWSSGGLVGDVQLWLDDPATNFGWILRGPETTKQSLLRFDSVDRALADLRPVLTIDYTPAPEPSALLLAAIACAARNGRAAAHRWRRC